MQRYVLRIKINDSLSEIYISRSFKKLERRRRKKLAMFLPTGLSPRALITDMLSPLEQALIKIKEPRVVIRDFYGRLKITSIKGNHVGVWDAEKNTFID